MSDNMGNCRRYIKVLATLAVITPSRAYKPDARWAQAATIIGNTLYVQGGKVDPSNMYSYSAAPNTNDLLSLDLSAPFALTDAPWAYVTGSSEPSTSQGPSVAFHSLTAFNETAILAFGGDGGSSMASPSGSNSAWLLDLASPSTPRWLEQSEGWANEPIRSIRHAAASSFGRVWIIGGEKADGSSLAVAGHYVFQPSIPSFDLLPTDSAPPTLYGHASVRLGSNILLVFGGYDASSDALVDMNSLWLVDTSLATPVWSTVSATGDAPTPRRDFAYTLLGDGRVFVHGGTDATMQTVYSDAAILDATRTPMQWSSLGELEQVGARRNHMAIGIGAQVLITFGFGANGPAPASLLLFETDDNSWGTTFTPVPTPTALPTSAPNPSATNPSSQGTLPPAQSTGASSQSTSQPVGTQTIAPGTSHVSNPGPVPTKSQSHTNRPSHTSSTAISSPTSSLPPGGADGPASNLKKIAIGAVVAVVVLVGLVLCGAYFALRRRRPIWRRGDGSARLIAGESSADEGYGSGATEPKGIPLAGSSWQALHAPRRQWTLLGLGTRQGYGRERFDILHDEDIREFGDFSASRASVRREASQGSGRSGWGGVVNASTASLRSFGAAFGLGRGARQSSYGSTPIPTPEAREKEASDPFLDTSQVLYSMPGPSITRPRAVRQESSSSLRAVTYANPFDDSIHDPLVPRTRANPEEVQSFDEREGLVSAFRQQDLEDHGHYDHSEIPASLETYGLAALGRPRSNSDLAHSGGSVSSRNAPAFGSGSATVAGSASSHDNYAASLLSSAPSVPIRRSDSWWSRFSRGTLRGDRTAHDGFSVTRKLSRNSDRQPKPDAFLDFRDPNPPPTLRTMAPIRESGITPDVSPQTPNPGVHVGSVGAHRRSASSLVTVQTADSAALERMGQVDIVQRVRTASYHAHAHSQSLSLEASPELVEEETPATKPITRRPRLSIVPGSPSKTITESGHSRASTPSLSEDHGTIVASPTELASSVGHASSPTKATTPVQARTRRPTGEVAKRVADYERRMTETNAGASSPRKSPVGGEDRPRSRVRVEYGLVPRPELFIANPDGRSSPST